MHICLPAGLGTHCVFTLRRLYLLYHENVIFLQPRCKEQQKGQLQSSALLWPQLRAGLAPLISQMANNNRRGGAVRFRGVSGVLVSVPYPEARAQTSLLRWVKLVWRLFGIDTPRDQRCLSYIVCYVDGFLYLFYEYIKVTVITIPAVLLFCLETNRIGVE